MRRRSLDRHGRRHGVLVLLRRALGLVGVWRGDDRGRRLGLVRCVWNVGVEETY
jgi:hypothetical protein